VKPGAGRGPLVSRTYLRGVAYNEVSGNEARTGWKGRGEDEGDKPPGQRLGIRDRGSIDARRMSRYLLEGGWWGKHDLRSEDFFPERDECLLRTAFRVRVISA
jgi:hypothetical protein